MARKDGGINEGPVKKGGLNGPARTPPPTGGPKPRPSAAKQWFDKLPIPFLEWFK